MLSRLQSIALSQEDSIAMIAIITKTYEST
jgi:hypothetical protein